jgi:hypothetical protein
MTLAKTLLMASALVSLASTPALAGGWGGRYAAHYDQHRAESFQYRGEEVTREGGYHDYGGGMSRTEASGDTGWRYRRLDTGERIDGPPLAMAGCGARGESHWQREAWVNGRPVYHREGGDRFGGPPVRCPAEGLVLPGSFFADTGGVGGFGGGYDMGGGGGGVVFAGAGAHASAFASASARVSIRVGGHGGHMGHRGGCGCGGHH